MSRWPRALPSSGPSIAIFEAHHIVELRSARLEQGAVLERLHAMPRARRQVDGFAGSEHPFLPHAFRFEEQAHASFLHVEALLLAHVVLQAQGLSPADLEHLARVALGVGEDDLLAPGLRHAADHRRSSSAAQACASGDSDASLSRTRDLMAAAVSRRIASSAMPRASRSVRLRRTCFTAGMVDGVMLSSVTPSPISTTAAGGLLAISPQTESRRPSAAAASATRRTRSKTAG